MKKKVCTRCGDSLLLEFFTKKKTAKDGRHSWCKLCDNHRKALWLEKKGIIYSYSYKKKYNSSLASKKSRVAYKKSSKGLEVVKKSYMKYNKNRVINITPLYILSLVKQTCPEITRKDIEDNPFFISLYQQYLIQKRSVKSLKIKDHEQKTIISD